jgi:peptidoglycan/LPS O-acetylase OafA/YrhL
LEKLQTGPLPAVSEAHYQPQIDGLRAVAVLAVIAHHFHHGLLPSGYLGVDIFFVISGYVISTSILSRPYKSIHDLFLHFYSRRVKRIIPALVVCVLVTALLGVFFIDPEYSDLNQSLNSGALSLFGLSNIYFSYKASDYFGATASLNLFTHTWSLGVEEQFYLLFPALIWLVVASDRSGRSRLAAALGIATALSFVLFLWRSGSSSGAYFLMPMRLWELGVGCLIATVVPSRLADTLVERGSNILPWLASLLIGAALVAPAELQLFATPIIVVATACLIVTLRPKHPLFRLLTQRTVLLIGLMSYSLYLWHWSVLAVSRWTVGVNAYSAPFQLAAILSLGVGSYFLIERPLRSAQWSRSRLATIALGILAITLAFSIVLALRLNAFGSLYTGAGVELAAKGVETLEQDKWHDGKIEWKARDCILTSDADLNKTITAEQCSIDGSQAGSKRRFLVIGNSFAAAEYEMYSALSEQGLGTTIPIASWGASAVAELPNKTPWSRVNTYFWNAIVPDLLSSLRAGDFVIMVFDVQGMTPPVLDNEAKDRLGLLKTGLERMTGQLRERGIQVVFQTSIPNIREANCAPSMARPQWFHFGRAPPCQLHSKSTTIARRLPLLDVLNTIENENSNFHVLDLLPLLCPGEVCGFFNSKMVPMYRDVWSHPSVEADYLARPYLLAVVRKVLERDASVQ